MRSKATSESANVMQGIDRLLIFSNYFGPAKGVEIAADDTIIFSRSSGFSSRDKLPDLPLIPPLSCPSMIYEEMQVLQAK
jgi:hypothetical protein